MKKTFLFFLFIFLSSCTKSKTANTFSLIFENKVYRVKNPNEKLKFLDSLNSFSNSLKNDSLTRKFLFDLSSEYYYLNKNTKSLSVSQRILKLSEQAKDTNAIAKSYYYIGDTYEVSHKDSAYYYYQKAEKLYRNLKNDLMTGRMQFNKAYLLFYEGNYIESEILLSKALQLLKKSDDKKLLYSTYNLMGANFGKLEESDNAIKYYMLAKGVLNDLIQSDDGFDKKNNFKISTSVNLAEIYRQRAQYKKAILELESVLSPNLKKEWPEYYE